MNEPDPTTEPLAPAAPAFDGLAGPETAPAAPASPSPQSSPQSNLSDLESLVAAFDRETSAAAQNGGNPQQASAVQDASKAAADAYARAVASGVPIDEMRAQLVHQGQALQQLYVQQYQQRDERDFAGFVAKAEGALKEIGATVPADYARTWLQNEFLTNGELRRVLDHRYDNAESGAQADRAIRRTMQQFVKQAKSQPDPEATANREAVAAAVRGFGRQPEAAPKDYGKMSDVKLREELISMGITPGF